MSRIGRKGIVSCQASPAFVFLNIISWAKCSWNTAQFTFNSPSKTWYKLGEMFKMRSKVLDEM